MPDAAADEALLARVRDILRARPGCSLRELKSRYEHANPGARCSNRSLQSAFAQCRAAENPAGRIAKPKPKAAPSKLRHAVSDRVAPNRVPLGTAAREKLGQDGLPESFGLLHGESDAMALSECEAIGEVLEDVWRIRCVCPSECPDFFSSGVCVCARQHEVFGVV